VDAVHDTAMLAQAIHHCYDNDHPEDLTDIYEYLQPLMSPRLFKMLGAALEFCPVHFCDLRICEDDQLHGDEVYD